ncbi:MAG: metal-dependent hydrolase [Pyrinomonadaceae bacterium]
MDNLTHTLVGLTGAKAGLERLSPYATTVCIVAANAPDVDVVSRLGGPWFALQHHRGITHSIVGTLTLALLIPLICWAIEKIITRIRHTQPRIRLRGLMLASLLACATHPLLDWLNSYGLRPFLPWSGRWYYGDVLFILDPWLWLILGGAAFLLTARTRWRTGLWCVLALLVAAAVVFLPQRTGLPLTARWLWLIGIALFVGAKYTQLPQRFGARVAQAALALVVLYCAALAGVHERAQAQARGDATLIASQRQETLRRMATMPTLSDPLHWLTVAETDQATYRFPTNVRATAPPNEVEIERIAKPQAEAASQVALAEQDARARVLLGFARFPVVQVQPADSGGTLVRFADLRFGVPSPTRTTGLSFTLEVLVSRHTP